MATCFLFSQYCDDENFLSLRLSQQGQVDAPLLRRTRDEVKTLQQNARTIVVLPGEICSMHSLELPWLNDRKARAAIPYALEEHVAQNVANLHFSFDRHHYQNGRYLIVAVDKQYLQDLIARLDRHQVQFDEITLDWFALKPGEACVGETSLLVNDKMYTGALSLELAPIYLNQQAHFSHILVFPDSAPLSHFSEFTSVNCLSQVWIAQQLLNGNRLNLCQGEFKHDVKQDSNRRWYYASAILFGIWLVSLLGINAMNLYGLTMQINRIDQQIAKIYHVFFPTAQQVVSPRFRISQLLKNNSYQQDEVLWNLLSQISKTFKNDPYTILHFRFQNQAVVVTIQCRDFAMLEEIEASLKKTKLKVRQIEAATTAQRVVATLELTQP